MNPVKNRFRYLVVFLGLACLTSILSNYIIINFTFICMKDDPTGIEIGDNGVGFWSDSDLQKFILETDNLSFFYSKF